MSRRSQVTVPSYRKQDFSGRQFLSFSRHLTSLLTLDHRCCQCWHHPMAFFLSTNWSVFLSQWVKREAFCHTVHSSFFIPSTLDGSSFVHTRIQVSAGSWLKTSTCYSCGGAGARGNIASGRPRHEWLSQRAECQREADTLIPDIVPTREG